MSALLENPKVTLYDLSSTLYAVALVQAQNAFDEGNVRHLGVIEVDNPKQAEMMRATADELSKYQGEDPEGVAFERRFWCDLADGFENMVSAVRSGQAGDLPNPDELNERARHLAIKYA
jgi:hypothetical protein